LNNYFKKILILSLISLPLGIIVGGLDFIFGQILINISSFRIKHFNNLIVFLPVAGLFIAFIYQKFAGKASQGMGLIFKVGQGKEENIPLRLIPLSMISTWISHLFGASVGREGVAVQLGASLFNNFSKTKSLKNYQQDFSIIGMAAGFAGLFQTPLAATFFALEVLVVKKFNYKLIIPSLIASYSAALSSNYLGLEKFSKKINSLNISGINLLKILLLALFFGLTGLVFSSLLKFSKTYFAKIISNPLIRITSLGIVLTLILFLAFDGRYSGLGTNLIEASLNGGKIYSFDFLAKLLLTIFSLAIGFQGGEVTPLFSIGSSLGSYMSSLIFLPTPMAAALGYICVFASATNTYFAPILIGVEIFGFNNLTYFILAVTVNYFLNNNKSIYAQDMS